MRGDPIPDGETLFRFIKPEALPPGQEEIPAAVFQDTELSCDWQQYRPDPMSSFHIAEGKSVIIAITVCEEIRNPTNPKRSGQVVPEWRQEIIHDPLTAEDDPVHGANDSHSLIRGRKKLAVTAALCHHSRRWQSESENV